MKVVDSSSLDVELHLLDHQVIDSDDEMICNVDDLELSPGDDGRLYVTAILTGPGALGPRLGKRSGEWMTAAWRRLRAETDPPVGRVDWHDVIEVGSSLRIRHSRRSLELEGLETWVREHFISRIPGAKHDSDD